MYRRLLMLLCQQMSTSGAEVAIFKPILAHITVPSNVHYISYILTHVCVGLGQTVIKIVKKTSSTIDPTCLALERACDISY